MITRGIVIFNINHYQQTWLSHPLGNEEMLSEQRPWYTWEKTLEQLIWCRLLQKYDSRSSSLMAAIREPDVIISCQSQLNSESRRLKKMIRTQIWVRWSFALSLPAQKCWNKELFLHFKVALPTARATIFRGSSNRNRERDGKKQARS